MNYARKRPVDLESPEGNRVCRDCDGKGVRIRLRLKPHAVPCKSCNGWGIIFKRRRS